jgi:HPt (histidine-containing phosphotransfer) domain-containing protein
MIDWERVEELKAEVGEDDFAEIADLFLAEVEEVVTRLMSAPDVERLAEDCHFLKGSAVNLGFSEFARLCQIGERLAAAGRGAEVGLAELAESFAASRRAFFDGAARRAA